MLLLRKDARLRLYSTHRKLIIVRPMGFAPGIKCCTSFVQEIADMSRIER